MGYLLALVTALLVAASDVMARQLFQHSADIGARDVAAARMVIALPILSLALPLAGPPPTAEVFWWVVAIGVPLELVAVWLYVWAIRSGPLAAGLPVLAITPALLILTGPLLGGEAWVFKGGPGVALIVVGTWVWQSRNARAAASTDGAANGIQPNARQPVESRSWLAAILAPLAALLHDKTARAMLAVAVIFSLTGALTKRAVMVVAVWPMVYYYLALALLVVAVLGRRPREWWRLCRQYPWLSGGIGIAFGAQFFTHMAAVSLIPVAEMVAIKRLSLLFAPLAAMFLLGEKTPSGRLLGAAMMVGGAIWIGIS